MIRNKVNFKVSEAVLNSEYYFSKFGCQIKA